MNSIFRDRRRGLIAAGAMAAAMVLAGVAAPALADQSATPAGELSPVDAMVKKYDHPMGSQIRLHAIVVEQRVVAVEKEHDVIPHGHVAASSLNESILGRI